MTVKEILYQLQSLGDASRRAHNIKYGAAKDNHYGVKMGDIRKLAKKIKTNHELALELWDTQIVEARFIAILILKPNQLSAKELDTLIKSITFSHVADWFNSYVLKGHPEKEALRSVWLNDANKWAARSGWSITAGMVAKNRLNDELDTLLDRIETEMPTADPAVQWTMNTTLATIGIHHAGHRKRALDIGHKLGIYKDYPVSKGCTSPFAPIWIEEMVKRQEK